MDDLIEVVHKLAVEKGFWDKERNFGELIALCHSELSEALEQARLGFEPNFVYYEDEKKPCGIASELADCLIRILDICGHYKIDIEAIMYDKIGYNMERERMHGKVF